MANGASNGFQFHKSWIWNPFDAPFAFKGVDDGTSSCCCSLCRIARAFSLCRETSLRNWSTCFFCAAITASFWPFFAFFFGAIAALAGYCRDEDRNRATSLGKVNLNQNGYGLVKKGWSSWTGPWLRSCRGPDMCGFRFWFLNCFHVFCPYPSIF